MSSRSQIVVGAVMFVAGLYPALSAWQQPPREVLDVLHATDLPWAWLSPTGDTLLLGTPLRYPPIADLAQPMLPLAGVRINPQTNGHHAESYVTEIVLKSVADGREKRLALPADARVTLPIRWAADGRRFALTQRTADGIELWVGEVSTGAVRRIPNLAVNPLLGSEVTWMPDQRTLLVKRVPPERGAPPEKPLTPEGPMVQESIGRAPSSTYEVRDVLTSVHDEALFEFYSRSQLTLVDPATGELTPLGEKGIFARTEPSPDGRLILVERIQKPWSYLHAWNRFPRDIEIWDRSGRLQQVIARLPLADQVPIRGVAEGPRGCSWRPTEPATLIWIEALDGGDPGRKVDHRDRVMMQKAPFAEAPREIYRAPHRVDGRWWGERGLLLVSEFERERRWRYLWAIDADAPATAPRRIFDLSANDRYGDPGWPVERQLPTGGRVLVQDGDAIFLSGDGGTHEGDRPFLDRFSLRTLEGERLFRSDRTGYEWFVDWVDPRSKTLLTRRESPADMPNYFVRTLGKKLARAPEQGEARWESAPRQLTRFTDPTPHIRAITKRIVTYQRADGTPLSFTLYLPPGYREGTRLPTILDAYPLEYSDPATAGQVSGTDRQFTRLAGPSHLFFLLAGYAVLDDVRMPVIGDPDTAYDTFIEQLVASAKAAIDKAVELGVTDPERVGVMGHSHGALMTATLLAHSDLFRAGIARSGAYNHTMRPFGFQNERRTLWQASETYVRLSPVLHADKINEPLLLIHGASDQNPGTVPLQSEKLFEAVRGTGGTVRLVLLPHERHGYGSREAVEHVLAEQLAWFDRYVKEAGPRQASSQAAGTGGKAGE